MTMTMMGGSDDLLTVLRRTRTLPTKRKKRQRQRRKRARRGEC